MFSVEIDFDPISVAKVNRRFVDWTTVGESTVDPLTFRIGIWRRPKTGFLAFAARQAIIHQRLFNWTKSTESNLRGEPFRNRIMQRSRGALNLTNPIIEPKPLTTLEGVSDFRAKLFS